MRFQAPLILLVSAVLMAGTAAADIKNRKGWRVLSTPHSYVELNKKLDESIKANKMGLVAQASATVGAKARGITIPGNRVVGVYRPDFAVRMLKSSVPAGIEAPIRFYVTENDKGKTQLSYKTPSTVFAPYMKEGGKELRTLAKELDVIFAKIAADAVKP